MKTRIVWTKMWEDEWFQSLSDTAQKLFFYLITNSRINICGCYEITDRTILFDTRIKSLLKVKEELFPKVIFCNGWVYIKNAQGYGGYTGANNELALNKELAQIPQNIKDTLFSDKPYTHQEGVGMGIYTPINKKSEIINNKYNNIDNIDDELMQKIADHYHISLLDVKKTYDAMYLWAKSKGKTYVNYKAGLMNWVQKRIEENKIKLSVK